jgi:hypothetical protein
VSAAAAIAAFAPAVSSAQSQQLYFVGFGAPLGSLSSPGAAVPATYLRWDSLEGQLPRDLERLRLERTTGDTTDVLLDVAVDAVKSSADIAALYTDPEQDRRRREIIRWLDSEGDETVNGGNFALVIHGRINPNSPSFDSAWAHFASRADFNVARARYRAYLDVTPGSHVYELIGVPEETEGAEVRLGRVAVATPSIQVVPAPGAFEKVTIARCDAPERFKDHGALALTWDHGASNPTDRHATSILVAGYDLYCTQANVEPGDPAPRQLRALAGSVAHDDAGELPLAGLVKLNDQPLTISGSAASEERYSGHNPGFAQLYIAAGDLEARGILPGDRRDCYLAARDITGNYGATSSIQVVIPDRIPPPAPWDVRAVTRTAGNEFKLVWDHVDVRNYYEDFREDRTYCNLDTARFDARLDFVLESDDCENRPPVSIDLDVHEYLVYRFDDASQAAHFRDSDGDGYADRVERKGFCAGGSNDGEACWVVAECPDRGAGTSCDLALTNDGVACDPTDAPAGAANHLLDPPGFELVSRPSGRKVVEVSDVDSEGPAGRKGDVFWYRIAARDADGELSALSAPVRGFFPDRTPPARSELDRCQFGFPECTYPIEIFPAANPLLPFAIDRTPEGLAETVEAGCPRSNVSGGPFALILDFEELEFGRGAELTAQDCATLVQHCGDLGSGEDATVSYFDTAGELLGEAVYPGGISQCPPPNSVLDEECVLEVAPGQVLAGPPTIDCSGIGSCVDIRHEIGGQSFRWGTVCPGEWPVTPERPHLGREEIHTSVAIVNENGEASPERRFAGFVIENDPPAPPQALEFRFDAEADAGHVVWRAPEEPLSGTLLEWRRRADGFAQTEFVPHEGCLPDGEAGCTPGEDGSLSQRVTLAEPEPAQTQEEWCFRARSVARDDTVSIWSPERCALRGDPPEYLGWPQLPTPPDAGPLEARYLAGDGLPVVRLSDSLELEGCDPSSVFECEAAGEGQSCFEDLDGEVHAFCRDWCSRISIAGYRHFVAYRQSRLAGSPGEFHQVSPLVETVFCERGIPPESILADPLVKLLLFPTGHPWDGFRLVFVDRTPHVAGREYRYQLVFFDPRGGEIASVRTSNWVDTGGSP